jgi:hypothetical protein
MIKPDREHMLLYVWMIEPLAADISQYDEIEMHTH